MDERTLLATRKQVSSVGPSDSDDAVPKTEVGPIEIGAGQRSKDIVYEAIPICWIVVTGISVDSDKEIHGEPPEGTISLSYAIFSWWIVVVLND
jgi:hypothetical protein